MRSPLYFIVKPFENKRYANSKKIGDKSIVTSSNEEDHTSVNRLAIVVATPAHYKGPVKDGDMLLIHHNVFKVHRDTRGWRANSFAYFNEETFCINEDQFFMYKNDDGWHAHDRHSFVKPVAVENDYKIHKRGLYEPLKGVMMYPTDYLLDNGIDRGDVVGFTPESEYEFEVDGEVLYRVFDHQITIKYD